MPTDKDEYQQLIEAEIEERFREFKSSFWTKIRKPAIGIVVSIAALVALAGVYVYIDAASRIYKSQAELAKAQKDFYEKMMEYEDEVRGMKNQMVENFNVWADDAERSMLLLQEKLAAVEEYDRRFQKILDKHKEAFNRGPHDPLVENPFDNLFEIPEPQVAPPKPADEKVFVPPPPAQKSYKISPEQMQQGILN